MSEATTGLFNTAPVFPRLVLDETLKRARVETSEGVAVRVTSAAADLTPITDALGTQQDPAETPTVIGLLKNLIANGGGGGGGGGANTTLQVPRIQIYDQLSLGGYDPGWGYLQITFTLNNEAITSFPDWADYIGFYSMQNGYLGVCKLKDNGSNKIIVLEVNARAMPSDPMQGMNLQLNKDYVKIELDEVIGTPTVPLAITFTGWNEDWAAGTDPSVTYYDSHYYADFIPFVFSLSSFDVSGGGGGGGGEAISTYSLTLNNVTVTDITAPTEDPPSSDDQTLVTVSYRRNLPVQLSNDLVNNQSTTVAKEASVNLETDFSITLPEWTELIKLGITNSGGYMDYVTMAADVNKSYVSVTGAGTIDVYSYNASTKDFTFVSGGDSIRILSLRVEGKTTI